MSSSSSETSLVAAVAYNRALFAPFRGTVPFKPHQHNSMANGEQFLLILGVRPAFCAGTAGFNFVAPTSPQHSGLD